MTSRILSMPEDLTQLPGWLEEQIMGTELASLIDELQALHGATQERAVSLTELLGPQREAVLERGLGTLARLQLRQLLRQPSLLLDLQEEVLQEGGAYWDSVPVAAAMEQAADKCHARVMETVRATYPRVVRWPVPAWAWVASAAACVLLALAIWDRGFRAHEQAFAWTMPQTWPEANRGTFFRFLADQAERFWTTDPPETADQLARRMGEFRIGCSVLLLAKHEQLDTADQNWLRERCEKWARARDEQRKQLETPAADVADIRTRTGEIVANLVKALRERGTKGIAWFTARRGAAGHNSAGVLIAFVPADDDMVLGGGMEIVE
jgi:hypothetical protein